MKKILCFGDSNTYGFIPGTAGRYDINTRWSGILKKLCENKFDVTEAGCNNRTAFCNNPAGIEQTGFKILPELLKEPYDIVILAIGINDLQFFFSPSEKEIEEGIEALVEIVRTKCENAEILLAAPSVLSENVLFGYFSSMFDRTSIEKSYLLSNIYKRISIKYNTAYIDLNKIADVSEIDGLHYEPGAHKKIAQAVFDSLE